MCDRIGERQFKELLNRIHKDILKPLGFKKDGSNFRLYHPDGLCKIINFQKRSYNYWYECEFTINIGIYYEAGEELTNVKFKERQCWLRGRAAQLSPSYRRDVWWKINALESTDLECIYSELKSLLEGDVMAWFGQFLSKEEAERMYGYKNRFAY